MKTRLQAGAELDLISKDEMREVLQTVQKDWFSQVARGDRYPRFSAAATIADSGFTIDGTQRTYERMGPAEGFVWAVQRIAVDGLTTYTEDTLATEPVALYLNDTGPSSLVHPALVGYHDFSQTQLVMYPGDTLVVVGADLTATGQVTVTGQARELPMPLAWRIGG